jgi:non-homologous end joining protein Ku
MILRQFDRKASSRELDQRYLDKPYYIAPSGTSGAVRLQ